MEFLKQTKLKKSQRKAKEKPNKTSKKHPRNIQETKEEIGNTNQ